MFAFGSTYGQVMAYLMAALRALSDEQLIAEHDEKARHTVTGTDYYVEELDRRSRNRAAAASQSAAEAAVDLAKKTVDLTRAILGLTVVAAVAAVIALFLR